MELTREKIRLLLMHEYLAGLNAAKATERINDAWGSGTVGRQTAYDWFAKFKAGEDNLNDQPRSGRPKEVELENSVINYFNSKDEDFYARGIDLLPEKWQEVVDVDGEYFDY